MSDIKLKDLLPKVGIKTFIEFFEEFKSNKTNKEIIKKFEEKYSWKDGAKRTKASKGKGIFKRNLELDALLYVINSFNQDRINNGEEVVLKAIELYNEYSETKILTKKNLFISETERDYLIKMRIKQGKFRSDLINFWESCSVTGFAEKSLLIASHIKPWKLCNDYERIDISNGLVLTPNLDKLFDKYLISFDSDGRIMISESLLSKDLEILNIDSNLKIRKVLDNSQKKYLLFHNSEFEIKNSNILSLYS